MKTVIKTTIGIMAIAITSISVAQAENHRRDGGHSERNIERKMDRRMDRRNERHSNRHEKRRDWKYSYKRGHRNGRYTAHDQRRYSKRPHHRVDKHIYRGHGYGHRRIDKHVYHHGPRYYAPRHRVTERVIVRDRHHHSAVPVIIGGLIGSAIGHDIGHGDPVVTFSSTVLGAMVGDSISRH